MSDVSKAKRRLVEQLKRRDGASAPELAAHFRLTDTAVRQHLEALEKAGLVRRTVAAPQGRGRPPVRWKLTPLADDLFPDRHGELTVELLDSIRSLHGEEGLDRVIDARRDHQLAAYRDALPAPGSTSIKVRVRRLADLRSAEGYLAETRHEGRAMVLVEHHCPVCDAASTCQGLCRAELELFQAALGDDVVVERTQHLLSGGQRCAYRITPR